MLLSEFNQTSVEHQKAFLLQCVHIPRWGEEIIHHGPFDTREGLLKYAEQHAITWTWDEILAALNTHPRIGERRAKLELSEQEQTFSRREQARITHDQEVLDALYKGNLAYEKKFGFIFLIKASGLNSEDILTALEYRLLNDFETEKRIVHRQLLEIALLRLSQEIQA